jgi:1-aminocyclopropane-1-carboxylate deaminase
MLTYHPTPFQEIRLLIKREDLNHPFVSGNKWWKLKFNLEKADQAGMKTILTFGGAFSNHIYATAAAANELGFQSIGMIRGEEVVPLNDTLQFATQKGMRLHYISRSAYRGKTDPLFLEQLKHRFGDVFLIPEGGTNELAVKGIEQFIKQLDTEAEYVCCPVGTGGTMAGIIAGLDEKKKVIGFSALKDGSYLNNEVASLLVKPYANWQITTDYHFGGYAKTTPLLNAFIERFKELHGIPLDFVYTGKMIAGIFDLVSKGFFEKGSTILAIHTGGIRRVNLP